MENNGWQFDLTDIGAEIGAGIRHNCNPGTFYGYNKDSYKFNEHYVRRQRVYGWANTTFNGKGLAVLNIANCNNDEKYKNLEEDIVEVLLNDNDIGHAHWNTSNLELVFPYHIRDRLSIKQVGKSILQINSLHLVCHGKCVGVCRYSLHTIIHFYNIFSVF